MRRWGIPIAALVLLMAGAFWYQERLSRSRASFPAPDFSVIDLQGNHHRLSEFRGKVVLLNIWATWCAPCRQEMPSMEVLQRKFEGRDFVILAVSQDEDGRSAVEPFVKEFGLTFPVMLDPQGEVGQKYGVTGYPETFLIDKSGTVQLRHIGFANWADERNQSEILKLIGAPAGSPAST